ncbi:2-isopropylmalate synthase [Litoribrevibacter euphylliae]|uniref:2-isopropylmalate synthase n=1 Tax=Litoribrevibacter euphylliae TaxID=1834034 RepID=A0ABV7HIG3_9GAMM
MSGANTSGFSHHLSFNHKKYRPFAPIQMKNRTWPDQVITQAPYWCSVDLRDGNQALLEPMTVSQKQALYQLLVEVGFKEIEIGFPAASQPDYDFVRWLIEENQIPDDVTVQVLVQAREHLIEKTFEALKGVKRAVVHVYNSTSTVQREKVFKQDKDGIKAIAVQGAKWVQEYAAKYPETQWTFEYSPESFTGTEIDYAVEVANAVIDVWQPTPQNKVIINLPSTVEMATPNVFADQIEWFCNHVNRRDSVNISVHTHNDRGCAVAAAELAVMAGADRVEGTLMGNGERTGNMDIVTMAMNLYSQGIDPKLDLADMNKIVRVYKEATQMPVHPRHPYAGELVFTAFSGSHQDAIKKCLDQHQPEDAWDIAYLPIDPADLGRNYQEVIRVNSQSGKGGVAYTLDLDYGIQLPRWMQIGFSSIVQSHAEKTSTVVDSETIKALFDEHYMSSSSPYALEKYSVHRSESDVVTAEIRDGQEIKTITGQGNGAVSAFTHALSGFAGLTIDVQEFHEHALEHGSESKAIAYLQVEVNGKSIEAAAIHQDILTASLAAVLNCLNKYVSQASKAESQSNV